MGDIFPTALQFEFDSFEAYWHPLSTNQGPPGAYLAALSDERREALRRKLQQKFFDRGRDRPVCFNGKAWAVRGVVR